MIARGALTCIDHNSNRLRQQVNLLFLIIIIIRPFAESVTPQSDIILLCHWFYASNGFGSKICFVLQAVTAKGKPQVKTVCSRDGTLWVPREILEPKDETWKREIMAEVSEVKNA
jgi:hypothetical protein